MRSRTPVLLLAVSALLLPACGSGDDETVTSTQDVAGLKGERGFEEAKSKLDEARGDLASNQAHLRGVLTPAQSSAYATAFWQMGRVVAAREEFAKRATALAASLSKETRELQAEKKKVNCTDPLKALELRDLYENAKSLANAHVVGVGASAPANAVDAFYTYLATHREALRCLGKDLDSLEKDLGANHAQKLAQTKLERPELDDLALIKLTFQSTAVVSSVASARAAALERFATTQDGAAFKRETAGDPVSAAAGAALAILHVGTLGNDLASAHYKKFLKDALEGGSGDVASIANAVAMLDGVFESGRAQDVIARAAGFSKLAGRVAAGVGVVTSVISLVKDIERYEGDRLLHIARIAADSAALQASIVSLLAIAELGPAAAGIVLLTQTILAVAQYWHAHQAAGRRNGDTKLLLRAIGMQPKVADLFANADRDTLRALTDHKDRSLGLEPADVQALGATAATLGRGPEAFFVLPDDPVWIANAAEIKRVFALSSSETVAMLRATTAGTDGIIARVVFGGCVVQVPGVFANRQGALGAVARCTTSARDADERDSLRRLDAFLHAH